MSVLEFEKTTDQASAAGGIHHRFGIGDGSVLAVDERESVEQAFIGSIGADPGPPDQY